MSHEHIPWGVGELGYDCPKCGYDGTDYTTDLVLLDNTEKIKIFEHTKHLDWGLGCTVHNWIEAIECSKCGIWFKYRNGAP